ncbi:MAG: hypothetical protein ACR2QJ_11850 [Geminicoccaceae bacterium]
MSWIVHCNDLTAPVMPADGVFAAIAINHPLVIVSTLPEVMSPRAGDRSTILDIALP